MKLFTRALAATILALAATAASATPSTTFWTPSTTYTQPYLVPHLTYDTYFGELGAYPVDTGITVGVLPFDAVNGEVGFDLLYPGLTQAGFSLNGKVTLVEGKLAPWQPGVSVGVGNIGFTKATAVNLLHAHVGKTLPVIGEIGFGVYTGNENVLVDADGKKANSGVFLHWMGPEFAVNLPGLKKIIPAADFQSGKNMLGAAGGGLYFYFTDAIDLLVGPVFFLEPKLQPGQSDWLFTAQIDVDFDLRKAKK